MYAYFHDDIARAVLRDDLRRRIASARRAELAGAVASPPPPEPRGGLLHQLRAAIAALGRSAKRPEPTSSGQRL
jgi:hypothetical protein